MTSGCSRPCRWPVTPGKSPTEWNRALPLSLNADERAAAEIIQQSRRIAIAAQDVALAARRQLNQTSESTNSAALAQTLLDSTSDLISSLERLEFETPETAEDIRGYLAERLVDARGLSETAGAWQATAQGVEEGDFLKIAASDQQQLLDLSEELLSDFSQLEASVETLFQRDELELPAEIRALAKQLHTLVESITLNQSAKRLLPITRDDRVGG